MIQGQKGAGITGWGERSWFFGSALAQEEGNFLAECWNLSKEPGSEMWPGKSWAGEGETEENKTKQNSKTKQNTKQTKSVEN